MAKKYKRNTNANNAPAAVETSVAVEKPAASSAARRSIVEFNPDYTYVVKDLKRIGVLAGSFFVILIALSFILNR